jgi:hypothetical protein
MNRSGALLIVGLAIAVLAGCSKGTDDAAMVARRQVKVGLDADASKIEATPRETTIEDLIANKAPEGALAGRVGPFETTTWRVTATIKSVQVKKDGDYYMVLKGDKGGSTVVEVPDPKTCEGSPMHDQIAATRKQLDDKYHPTKDVKNVNDRATVDGVGFYGFGNNGKGASGKVGSRLMPGTNFQFKH